MKRILLIVVALMTTLLADARQIRILAIGNSFSQDSVEQYLWEIGESEGVDLIIGNMYIGGCSLQTHHGHMLSGAPAYAYRKIAGDGVKRETRNMNLEAALADEEWDYVTLQQASGFSGQYETYNPYVADLLAFVRSHVKKGCKVGWHMTWAYQSDSNHGHFPFYDRDQMKMYQAIVSCARKVQDDCTFDFIVPSGTAGQNARTSALGDTMTRDGFHMNLLYGRYVLACTWFETICGKKVGKKAFYPEGVTSEQAAIARKSAHSAVRKPYVVTEI